MDFNKHFELTGRHAFLSASKYHWINYDEEKMAKVFASSLAAQRGNEEHELAHRLIKLGIKLPSSKKTLNLYVNDAIGYRMAPEQILYYSENCFGTADAISFRRNKLRIHDLKTGVTPASEHQLEVYAAMFCLEYRYKPVEIDIELRLYQSDEVAIFEADPMDITNIMSKIVTFDKYITAMKEEALA